MNVETRENPYAPPTAKVSDFKEASETVEPAGRGVRFGAAMIDLILFLLLYVPVLVGVDFKIEALREPATYMGLWGLASLFLAIALIAVTTVLVYRNGQTIGKWLVDIKVVRKDGSRAGLGRIFWLRNFVNGIPAAIPIIGNFYVIVDHLFIFGRQRRCIHDLIAGTIVVDS